MSEKYDFFDFSQANTDWSWQELLFGIENKIVNREEIVRYAIQILDERILGFDWVLKIAISDEHEDIFPYLQELTNLELFEEKDNFILNKWKYEILKELYDKKINDNNFNRTVEKIYADFGYPEDMSGFIGYMPSTDGKSMEEAWQEYLNISKMIFEPS